ncbi:unnamed protein product [Ixodes pacificus]
MTSPTKSIEVKLELGHRAVLRARPTAEGFTHDWTVFVRGPDNCSIQHFVDKVVFFLHESFPKPKRVLKEPPYQVSESGYAGFNMPVEVYFRTREDPKKVEFVYDLYLSLDGTPISNIRCEKLTFHNPPDDFCRKLLKAGGTEANRSGSSASPAPPLPGGTVSAPADRSGSPTRGSTAPVRSRSEGHKKPRMSSDMVKSPPVEPPPPPPPTPPSPPRPPTPLQPPPDRFAAPVKKEQATSEKPAKTKDSKSSQQSKSKPSKSHSSCHKSQSSSSGKEHKSSSRDKDRHKETSRDKARDREKPPREPKPPPPPPPPPPVPTAPSVPEPDIKTPDSRPPSDAAETLRRSEKAEKSEKPPQKHKDKEKDKSSSKDKKERPASKDTCPAPKETAIVKSDAPKTNSSNNKAAAAPRRPPSPPPPSKKPKLSEPDRRKKESKSSHRVKDSPKKPPDLPDKKPPPEPPQPSRVPSPTIPQCVAPFPNSPSPPVAVKVESPAPVIKEEPESPRPSSVPTTRGPLNALMLEMEQEDLLSPLSSPSASPREEDEGEEEEEEMPTVTANAAPAVANPPVVADHLRELRELKSRILNLEDPHRLQAVVDLVEGTGLYKVTEASFDFDLCALDPMTLDRLQECLNGR